MSQSQHSILTTLQFVHKLSKVGLISKPRKFSEFTFNLISNGARNVDSSFKQRGALYTCTSCISSLKPSIAIKEESTSCRYLLSENFLGLLYSNTKLLQKLSFSRLASTKFAVANENSRNAENGDL